MASHRSKTYALRPNDDGVTFKPTLRIVGFIGLANLSGWTAFGALVNEATNVRTYDSLTATIDAFNNATGDVTLSCASPTAPITAAKYRLEMTLVTPGGKKVSGPSPNQNQTFIDYRATG